MRLLLQGMTVLPMTGAEVIENGVIGIEDGKIAFVDRQGPVSENFFADEVIDARGMVATPGLVNCHTHAAMVLLRGYADDMPLMPWLNEKIWPIEAKLVAEDIYWGTLLACVEMIRSGTTTFADMYFYMDQVARAVEETGMRASLARGLIGVAPNGADALEENIAFVREWHNAAGGRITAMLGPHAPYTCPPDYLRKVTAKAEELGVGVHIHLAETRAEAGEIAGRFGKSPTVHLAETGLFEVPVLAAHCVHLGERDIEVLVSHQVGIAHNPQSNMKLASGIAPVARLLAAGARVGIGTDGASSNNDLDMVEEMRTASFLQKVALEDPTVLPAPQAAAMATLGGARALHLEKEIGTLEPGKKADVVLWDWSAAHLAPQHDVFAHFVYAAHAGDAHTVIIDGRVVMRDRRILTVDEGAVIEQAGQCARRLVRAVAEDAS
ncbi:amidohydrolase [Desulforudis sp. 1088]|uniref:amidohydrolase n=2 Tax=Candidatus Desulforudis TaxID=471826 RepID=UPI003CE46728